MNLEDLGRRAVACKHWRWMPGMLAYVRLTLDGKPYERRVQVVSGEGRSFLGTTTKPGKSTDNTRSWGMVRHVQAAPVEEEDFIPDLTDPATLGCLLALVREAWGDATADVIHFDVWKTNGTWGHEWTVQCRDAGRFTKSRGATEAEALVAALEAAP